MKGFANLFRDPLTLLLATLVVFSLMGAWAYGKATPGIDYYVAWVAADAVKNDTPHNIYTRISSFKLAVSYRNKADELKDNPRQKQAARYVGELQMTATPFLYWVTGLLASGDYEKDLDTWHAISLLLLTLSILFTCHLLGYSAATSLALLLPVLVWFAPFQADLRVANVNSFQVGVFGLIICLLALKPATWRLFTAGLAVGLLVMFKPNLAPIAVLLTGGWLVRRQFPKMIIGLSGMATGAISAVLVSSWWLGSATAWIDWLKLIGQVVQTSTGKSAGNVAIMSGIKSAAGSTEQPGFLEQFKSIGQLGALGQLTLVLVLCLFCLVLFWWGRRGKSEPLNDHFEQTGELIENTLLMAMGCVVTMLVSGLVWNHYFVLIIPMFMVSLRPLQPPGQMKLVQVLMQRLLPIVALVCLLDTVLQGMLGFDTASYWAIAMTVSVLTMFVVGLWQLGYGISDQPRPESSGAPAAH